MAQEIETKFIDIDVPNIIQRLDQIGAEKVFDERLFRRCVYNLPTSSKNAWARVRDEGDRVTMTYKCVTQASLDGIEEIELVVSDFETAREFLSSVGLQEKGYQETKRMRYVIPGEDIEFDIDTWPGLDPWIEIEGATKELVINYSEKLGFNWDEAFFGGPDIVYAQVYNVDPDWINNHCPRLEFDNLPFELQPENKRI